MTHVLMHGGVFTATVAIRCRHGADLHWARDGDNRHEEERGENGGH
jgi:hypothetical protein